MTRGPRWPARTEALVDVGAHAPIVQLVITPGLICPMSDMLFRDLIRGQIFTAGGSIHQKRRWLSAVALTGPTCGQAKTLLPTDFVELTCPRLTAVE